MASYIWSQIVFLLRNAVQLLLAMSTGALWITQLARLWLYALTLWPFFLHHWWWYVTTPNTIRRVAYRSSESTKRRNILRVLANEGVDLQRLMRAEQQQMRCRGSVSGEEGGGGAGLSHNADGGDDMQRREASNRARGRRNVSAPAPSSQGITFMDATTLADLVESASLSLNPADGSTMKTLPPQPHMSSKRKASPPRAPQRGSYVKPPMRQALNLHGAATETLVPPNAIPDSTSRTSPAARTCGTDSVPGQYASRQRQGTAWHEGEVSYACSGASPTRHSGGVKPRQAQESGEKATEDAQGGTADSGIATRTPSNATATGPVPASSRKAMTMEDMPHTDTAEGEGDGAYSLTHAFSKTMYRVLLHEQLRRDRGPDGGSPVAGGQSRVATVGASEHISGQEPPTGVPPYTVPLDITSSDSSSGTDSSHEDSAGEAPEAAPIATDDEDDDDDTRNLHNRATVDIVLPVPMDVLLKALDYAKKHRTLHRKRFPIAIIVTGGSWIIGSHLWSTILARVLAARGYVVFCPDYRNFPQTTMEGMVLDISDALAWVLNNADRYNGNLDDVTLVGQSAGAHLTMMSLLSQAHLCAYNAAERDNEGLPPPSDVAYNVPRYNPRKSIHRYVGLSGTYNVAGLMKYFDKRGLYCSVLCKIAGGKAQLPRYSIPCYFDERRGGETGETLPDNLFDYLPAKMCFLHGDADKSSPVSESASLVSVLRQAQRDFTVRRIARYDAWLRHVQRSRSILTESWGGTDPPYCRSGEMAEACKLHDAPAGSGGRVESSRTAVTGSAPGALPPVKAEFILIPGSRHTDPFLEECLIAGRSCCVDFLCDYECAAERCGPLAGTQPRPRRSGGVASARPGPNPGAQVAAASRANDPSAPGVQSHPAHTSETPVSLPRPRRPRGVVHCVAPDAVLPMAVPVEVRPLALRLCMRVSPF